MIKTYAVVCRAVWITDMGYTNRRYKKTGLNMGKNGKKLVGMKIITN